MATNAKVQNNRGDCNEKAQLTHALIDVEFLHKPKIIALRRKFGDISALAVIEIICQLSRATNAEIEEDTALAVIEALGLENSEEILGYIVERGIIERTESGMITQERVRHDQEKLAKSRSDYAERQRRYRVMSPSKNGDNHATETVTRRESVNTELLNTEDLNVLGEGGPGETKPEPQKFLESLDSPQVRDALKRWTAHNAALKPPKILGILEIDALQMLYDGRAKDLISDINTAISGRWRNLRPTASPPQNAKDPPKSVQRRNAENLKAVLEGKNPWADDPIFGPEK